MADAVRKFATEDEALAFILDVGDTPEARALALAWELDWDRDIVPLLETRPALDPVEHPSEALDAAIAAGDAEEALFVNSILAEEMPFAKGVEIGFCHAISEAFGAERCAEAKGVWRRGRKASSDHWSLRCWQDMVARTGKPKLEDLSQRLETVKPKIAAEPKKAEPLDLMDRPYEAKPRIEVALVLPGVAGELQDYYLRTSMQPSPVLSLIPGLVLPALLACENVIGPSGPRGCVLQQTIVGLAPTGGGKQTVIALIKRVLLGLKEAEMLGPSRFKSGNAVIKWVKDHRISLSIQDEFGAFMKKLGNPRANPCEFEINERLREFYSLEPGEPYTSPEGMTEDSELIENPHLNILGFGNRDEFFEACKADDIVNGFLNRITVIEEQALIKPRRDFETIDLPFPVFERLMKIRGLKPHRLGWGPGAEEVYQAQLDWVFAQEDDRKRKLWVRSPEKLVRKASGFAVSRLDRRVLRSDMELAKVIMDRSDGMFKSGIDDAEGKRQMDHAELRSEVVRVLRGEFEGQASPSELKKRFRHNTKFKGAVEAVLGDMVASGMITALEALKTGGRDKRVHRLIEE